jgi:hypothetical protein
LINNCRKHIKTVSLNTEKQYPDSLGATCDEVGPARDG